MMPQPLTEILEAIRPTTDGRVMDLVEAAQIDVSAWARKQDGTPVKNPRANPNFCYEWAFGGGGEPTALCVWHSAIKISEEWIVCEDSLRQAALNLEELAADRDEERRVRSRARDQARRARVFDALLQRAFRNQRPVRVILLVGEPHTQEQLGSETSKVRFRSLDVEPWHVHSYSDGDGSFRLVRGVPLVNTVAESGGEVAGTEYVDQFSIPDPPEKRESIGTAYARSPEVRRQVLVRAAGACEACGQKGFKTASGAIFLETHHVIPLAQQGPDVPWNVVAICPNDHRRAHHGADRAAMREMLVEKLGEIFPDAKAQLGDLLNRCGKAGG